MPGAVEKGTCGLQVESGEDACSSGGARQDLNRHLFDLGRSMVEEGFRWAQEQAKSTTTARVGGAATGVVGP